MLALPACGGGGGGAAPVGGGPTPCPAGFSGVAPSCTQFSASGTLAVGTSASTAPLPPLAGYTPTIQLPSASASTTAAVTTSTQPPAGIAALSSTARRTQTVNTPLLYFTFVPSSATVLNGIPGFTVTLPAGVSANQTFYIALEQSGSAGWQTVEGPGSVSGQTVTFAPAAGSIALAANQPIYFAFYAGGVVPSTPILCTQPSVFTVTPCPMSFAATGAAKARQLTIAESGYAGAFTAQINDCTNVVSITPASGTTFTVTPNAPGNCTLHLADTNGNTAAVPISVTVTQVGGQ